MDGKILLDLCMERGYGMSVSSKWGARHFNVALSYLKENETILLPMIGLHNYKSAGNHDGYYAYLFTNERMIVAQDRRVGRSHSYVVRYDNLNDIHIKEGLMFTSITFDTIREQFVIGVDKDSGAILRPLLMDLWMDISKKEQPDVVIKQIEEEPNEEESTGESKSAHSKLLELKELYDLKILTKEEYEEKRKVYLKEL